MKKWKVWATGRKKLGAHPRVVIVSGDSARQALRSKYPNLHYAYAEEIAPKKKRNPVTKTTAAAIPGKWTSAKVRRIGGKVQVKF